MEKNDIQTGLEQDARVVTERIPMSVTKDKQLKVAASLKGFMDDHKFSQRLIADKIGVSPAVISQFLAGKYKGDIDTLINKLVQLINTVSRKDKRIKNDPYIETTVAKRIATLITSTESFSDDEGKIGVLIGDGGHGKSHCLKYYAEANKNTILIELDSTMTSTQIFSSIARALSIDSTGYLSAITMRIIETLRERNMIVMLDEASSLSVKQLDQLRQIIAVKSRCPLILAGNNDLLRTIMQPTTRMGYQSLDQFTSRMMAVVNLDQLAATKGKGGGCYTADDIRKLYQYGGIKLTNDAVRALKQICMTARSGRLRTCTHIITALHTSSGIEEAGAINSNHIRQAIEILDLPVMLPIHTLGKADDNEEQVAAVAG